MKKLATFLLLVLLVVVTLAFGIPSWSQEKVDLDMIRCIRYEGFRNSKVMDLASGLMDGDTGLLVRMKTAAGASK